MLSQHFQNFPLATQPFIRSSLGCGAFITAIKMSTALLPIWMPYYGDIVSRKLVSRVGVIKAGPLRLKQLTNTLKIRILSETSILYLIRYASIILIVGLRL